MGAQPVALAAGRKRSAGPIDFGLGSRHAQSAPARKVSCSLRGRLSARVPNQEPHKRPMQETSECDAAHTPKWGFALFRPPQELPGFLAEQEISHEAFDYYLFFAAIGLLAAMTGISRSPSISTIGRAGAVGGSTLQDMQSGQSADKLPVDDFDDRSLVFPRESKR
jgi:hypothetical protein